MEKNKLRRMLGVGVVVILNSCAAVDESGSSSTFNTRSLTFDGSSEYLENTTAVVSNFPFTLSAWVKTTATSSQTVVGIFVSTSSNQYYRITLSAAGLPTIEASNTTARTASSATAINDGAWHHVAAVFASSTSRTLYVDGVSKATSTTAATFTATINRLSVGRTSNSAPGSYFNGSIDEVSLWSTGLAQADIDAVYNSGRPTDVSASTGILSFWRMGDASSDDLSSGVVGDVVSTRNLTASGMDATNVALNTP